MAGTDSTSGPFKEEYITPSWHEDGSRHYIGEALQPPTLADVKSTGTVTDPGSSPLVARADHRHDLEPSVAPTAGDIVASIATAKPGWLRMDGTAYVNADVNYPLLWAVAHSTWKSGSTLTIPAMANRVLMGASSTPNLGLVGGSMTHTLIEAQLAAHDHSITHTHTNNHQHPDFNTGTGGIHTHVMNTARRQSAGSTNSLQPAGTTGTADVNNASVTADNSVAHAHFITFPNYTGSTGAASAANSGSAGSGSAINHTPANMQVNFFIYTGL